MEVYDEPLWGQRVAPREMRSGIVERSGQSLGIGIESTLRRVVRAFVRGFPGADRSAHSVQQCSGGADVNRAIFGMCGLLICGLVVVLVIVLETAPKPQEKIAQAAKPAKVK